MFTLMTKPIFDEFCQIRQNLLSKFPNEVAGVFVPWAGEQLRGGGGIYYVGQATHDQACPVEQTSYDDSIADMSSWCRTKHDYYRFAFWKYFNHICEALLKQPAWECSDRWGWSNLLKLEYTTGSPSKWADEFIEPQRHLCVDCLRGEFLALRNSLVVIVSNLDFEILFKAISIPDDAWQTEYGKDDIYYWWDKDRSMLYVHGNHPNYALRKRPTQLERTIKLARKHLRWAT